MNLSYILYNMLSTRIPRVSGGEPTLPAEIKDSVEYSPRERG